MVIMIVMIVMVASVLRAKYRRGSGQDGADSLEADRLREEVKQLRERLQVLERITVEKENSLAREIEQLRDR
ncbi:MAG: hypothetical protein KF780_08110 [Sphingomonas sp.]|nr:hypothetical protein [Sphingomonas sp.]